MFKFDLEQTQEIRQLQEVGDKLVTRERVARLEARVEALERALAMFTAHAAALEPSAVFAKTQNLLPLGADGGAAPAAQVQAAGSDSSSALDRLGITAAFASLDMRVAEAAAAESMLGRAGRTEPAMFEIDASLIDKAFARPPPQKLDVRAAVEELHPKIAERVTGTWRTGELLQYLNKLIVDERGDRAGFAPAVMSELLLLSAILEAPEEQDAWAANPRTV